MADGSAAVAARLGIGARPCHHTVHRELVLGDVLRWLPRQVTSSEKAGSTAG
jgi:hypothetical protein